MKVLIIYMALIGFSAGALDVALRPRICYTEWYDRDDPSRGGDFETLTELRAEYPGEICLNPRTIEAVTLSGVDAASIGQVFQWNDRVNGFKCVNSQQRNGECCLDYKVRFGCPCPWPPPRPRPRPLRDPLPSNAEN